MPSPVLRSKHFFIQSIKNNPYLIFISTSTGLSDLELEFIVENSDKLIDIIENINIKFPNSIRNYSFYGGVKVNIETFLPKIF